MLSMRQVRGCSGEALNCQAVADLTLQNVRPCYQIPFRSIKYFYTPYPQADATNIMGLENSPQSSMSTQCKPNHTRRHRWASAGYAGAKGTRTQAGGTVEVRSRYANAGARHAHIWSAVQTPGRWQQACFCRCRCLMFWLLQVLRIQSSAQDTGHRGQASTNKGKTCTHTRTHAHKATTNTPPALPLSRVLCSLCLGACSLRPIRCTRAPRIPLQAHAAPKTHT